MVDYADDAPSGTARKFLSREAPSHTRPSYSNYLETFGSITPRIEVATGGLRYCPLRAERTRSPSSLPTSQS